MTLDEVVKDMETIAEENQRVVDTGIVFDDVTIDMLYCDDTEVIDEYLANYQKVAEKYRQIADWLKELKQLKEQTRWIPVSERLPEEDGQYLITVKYKHVNDSYEDVYAEHGEWYDGRWDMFCFGHCGEVEEIIAWMPLPAPYKPQAEREGKYE